MSIIRRLAGTAAALALVSAAFAHDFWIQPVTFRPSAGALVNIDLRIGDDVPGESFPRKSGSIRKFEMVGPDGVSGEIVGRDAHAPAGAIRSTVAGVHVLGYRSKPSSVELEPAKFESYLKEKGLEKIIAGRAASGRSAEPGREMFSRCAKSIIRVGGGDESKGFDRVLGYTLELVADNDPTALKSGEPFRAHLLHESKPCVNALVMVKSLDDAKTVLNVRTDNEGKLSIALPKAGKWMLTAVEMVTTPSAVEVNGIKPEFESLWASLSFQTPDWTAATSESKP